MTDSSVFSCLPITVRDSLLQQAFQQLDQRYLFGVAPRVCRLWHQLSLSTITRLEITICTARAAEQLSLWMANHGTILQHLSLDMAEPVCRSTSDLQPLLQSVGAAEQLRSLNISTPRLRRLSLGVSLTMLTKLTSLHIKGCTLCESIPHATTLRNLSINTLYTRSEYGAFMQQVSASLVQLSRLELDGSSGAGAADMNHLCALPQLQQLELRQFVYARELSKLEPLPITRIHINMEEGAEAGVGRWLHQSAAGLRTLLYCKRPSSSNAFVAISPLVPLQHAPLLTSLAMSDMQPNLTHLAALTQLTALGLNTCGLDDAGIVRLAGLSEFRILGVKGNKGISGAAGSMEVVAKSMPDLTAFYVDGVAAQEAARHFGPEKVKSW